MQHRKFGIKLALCASLLLFGATLCLFTAKIVTAERNHTLIDAIKHNNAQEVIDLLAHGADANAREPNPAQRPLWQRFVGWLSGKPLSDQQGRRALDVALNPRLVNHGDPHPLTQPAILKALINHGAYINLRYEDEYGHICTPLSQVIWLINSWAVGAEKTHYTEIATLLLKRGADPNGATTPGTPLPDFAPLPTACAGDVALVRQLLDSGADIHRRDGMEQTPLQIATEYNNTPVIALLLNRSAYNSVDYRHEDHDPILTAAHDGHAATVQMLLDHGADVNTRDCDGTTVLMCTADEDIRHRGFAPAPPERCKTARLLLNRGAEIDQEDSEGDTALMLAVQHDHPDLVSLLLDQGAKVNQRDDHGKTALDYCRDNGTTEMARLLQQHGARDRNR